MSAIACMSSTGLLDVKTITGTSDGDAFYDFVNTNLLPHLMSFNGTQLSFSTTVGKMQMLVHY